MIIRESLDFYRALVVGGIYQFEEELEITSISTYTYALRECIEQHPQLTAVVSYANTNSPYYAFCPRLDLNQHVKFLEQGDESEIRSIERHLPTILDEKWLPAIPAWKIVIIPFSKTRCFIGFSYSHSLGDGISGMIFHKTFLNALQTQNISDDLICTPSMKQINPAFDTAANLPISWSFLLAPLLGAYLPKSISSIFGFEASTASVTPGTWTAAPIFQTPEISTFRTGVQILSIDAKTVEKSLKLCRLHGAKLTGLIHQFILTALSQTITKPNTIDNFAVGTAIDMRKAAGISKDEMGMIVSGDFQLYPLQDISETRGFSWALAKSITEQLAARASTLKDQPIGLLRYLSDMRSWTSSKLGHRRDCSYAVSNLINFQAAGPVKRCMVTEMVFCQPTDVTAAPLTLNIVSAANGPMNISVSWQFGALGMASNDNEVEFVRGLCRRIEASFSSLI